MIKVGIVGGTGYTGVELLRLLARHPQAQVTAVTSRKEAGMRVAEMFPSLRGVIDVPFSDPNDSDLSRCDVVFFATPHGVAMEQSRDLLAAGVKVIDLAADFRLADPAVFEQWYKQPHTATDLLAESVYGLPEINREAIKKARIVGNPGCYPTAVQLGFLPLLEAGVIDTSFLIADCKSGVSGAGRKAEVATLMAEASDNFKAYGVPGHRHLPEIRQGLDRMAGKPVNLTFTPHLTPAIHRMERLATRTLPGSRSVAQHQAIVERAIAGNAVGAGTAARANWLTLGGLVEQSFAARQHD